MRRILTVVGALMLVAAFIPSTANAQSMNSIMQAALNDQAADAFACVGGDAPCALHGRLYGEFDPREINGFSSTVDGFPAYKAKPSRYLGDAQTVENYPNSSTRACEPFYSVWDGAIGSNTGTYISYYSWQSTLVNFSEGGGTPNTADCGGNTAALACFGANDATVSRGATDSSQGPLSALGSLSPVPVVRVAATATDGVLQLSVDGTADGNTLNLPSVSGVVCPPTAAFDDLTETNAPSAVYGVGLFFYLLPDGGAFRSLDDLEGAPLTTVLANPSSGMACTPGGADCPGVTFLPCGTVNGMACAGDLMAPQNQIGTVDLAAIEAALGGPLGANSVVFLTKVFYRGSVPGSQANPGNTTVSPSVVSLFSAASSRSSFNALAARVDITDLSLRGNAVRLAWQTVGSSFVAFTVQRANDGVTFVDLATVPADGTSDYEYTDQLRGRRPASATYRILAEDLDGNVSQVFESLSLSNGNGPRGR